MRETYEETGVKVAEMKFAGDLAENSSTKYNWINNVYISEIEHIAPPACNEGILGWIEFEDVLKVPTPKTDWFIYKYILEEKPFV
jgi:8-oxo-dGTP diphosphatase